MSQTKTIINNTKKGNVKDVYNEVERIVKNTIKEIHKPI